MCVTLHPRGAMVVLGVSPGQGRGLPHPGKAVEVWPVAALLDQVAAVALGAAVLLVVTAYGLGTDEWLSRPRDAKETSKKQRRRFGTQHLLGAIWGDLLQ